MEKIKNITSKILLYFHNLGLIYADPERKSIAQMFSEFLKCSIGNRCFAVHYLTSYLYRRNVNNIMDYIPIKEEKAVQDKINDPRVSDLVTNKLFFMEFFERGGFSVPNLLGYNLQEKMYLRMNGQWKLIDLTSPQLFKDALKMLMHNWNINEIFIKEIRGNSGIGALKIKQKTLEEKAEINQIFSVVTCHSYVFQEVIRQHSELSKMNPNTLNTMRIDTFRAPGEIAEIISAFLRVGGKDKDVDNVGSGGVLVGINLDNGKLNERAMNFFHGSQNFGTFISSPSTGLTFAGFQIPLFENVKETVIKAAEFIPSSLVGWDIAVSSTKPVLIEANLLYYGLRSSDMAYGGYRKNPVYRKVTAYVNNITKK